MKKIKALFRLLRFELPFSAGICVIMGQLLARGNFASFSEITFGFFSVFFISASILVLNDYFDIETNKINSPDRPIPSGSVSPSESLILSILLLCAGILLSYLINLTSLIFVIGLTIIGFLYNRKFKKSGLPGNLMVSLSVGTTFIYGAVSVGVPFDPRAWFFGIIAALIDLGEEIAADAMDMKGDLLINSNSIAIKYGRDYAIKISSYIFIFVILLTSVPFIFDWFSIIYLIPILIMNIAIFFPARKLLTLKDETGRKYIRSIYLGATFGLIVFLSMRLFGI